MDSMDELLKIRKPQEPPQVTALKEYAKKNHNTDIQVRINANNYLISVPGAALAHKFRIETPRIVEECGLDKRLVIHIGY